MLELECHFCKREGFSEVPSLAVATLTHHHITYVTFLSSTYPCLIFSLVFSLSFYVSSRWNISFRRASSTRSSVWSICAVLDRIKEHVTWGTQP